MRRRTYVATVGTVALAGCGGQRGETDAEEMDETEADETDETEADETDETDSAGFQKLWEAELQDEGDSADYHATSDATAAYLGTVSHLTALSLDDGTEQWTRSLDESLNGVAADDDGLYTLQNRTVKRVDTGTGQSRWETTAEGYTSGTQESFIATTDDHVAAGGADGAIVFEKESGQQTAQLNDNGFAPVRAWNGQFVTIGESGVTAYDPDGTAQWTVEDGSVSWLTPVAGSTVVGGGGKGTFGRDNGDRTFVGIDLDSGTQAWTIEANSEFIYAKTAATDDTVFVYPGWHTADTFYALNADTGAVRWEMDDTTISFPPVVLESAVVIPEVLSATDQGLQAREPKTGDQIAASDEVESLYGATGSGRTFVNYGERAIAYRL